MYNLLVSILSMFYDMRCLCVHQSYILILKTLGMLNGSLNKKVLQFGTIFSLVVLVTSLISTSYIQNSKALVQENEESAYLKFVTQTVNDSTNSSKNSSSATVQIPEGAKGPSIPPKGYLVEEIRDGLYWVTDGAYNTMFLVTDKGVVAVDAPPSLGQKYLRAIAEVTDKPVNYLIYSHAHIDHIGAAGLFPKNVTIIAQDETARELQSAKAVAKNITMVPPVPTVTFSKNYTLAIGNQTLKLDYYGTNHLPGNIFIYAPKQKVLMLVDIVFPGWVPFPYLAIAKDAAGFIKAHDIALNNYDFDTLVAGHLTRLGTRNDVIVQREFVSDLENARYQSESRGPFQQGCSTSRPF